jgi:hypothetical protein
MTPCHGYRTVTEEVSDLFEFDPFTDPPTCKGVTKTMEVKVSYPRTLDNPSK